MKHWNSRRVLATSASVAALALVCVEWVQAQSWDAGARLANVVSQVSGETLKVNVEQRERYESKDGNAFGKDPKLTDVLVRTRFSMTYTPAKWFKVSGMVQDSRAPGYGPNAPNTIHDPADLQEAYVEILPASWKGFGVNAGRMMLNYGEGRVIGTPQWSNVSRTYDEGRVFFKDPRIQVEFLLVSPVKIRIDEFNRPVMGERIWGTYNVLPDLWRKRSLEFYVLRHDQNRIGGFTGGTKAAGTDKMETGSVGFRFAGPWTKSVKFSLESIKQTGKVGPASLDAFAWFSSATKRWTVAGKPLDISAEYKYASGTENPANLAHTSTYDQISPANHDKFGHEDLFGWRNNHNARSLTTFGMTKNLAFNFMYDNIWLAAAKDSLYNSSGKSLARSATGTAGRHVGQETDVFATYKYNHFLFGGGYGYLFTGEFLKKTTPGVNPTYIYFFHTYVF